MNLISKLESILFVAVKPLSIGEMAKALETDEQNVREALLDLKEKYGNERGVWLLENDDRYCFSTNPENSEIAEKYVRQEVGGELTRAQLETLTVIAYRGPITRPELEQIRGVNCALILRNLLIRGLVEEKDGASKVLSVYTLSFPALARLGISSAKELPDYEKLSVHENLETVLSDVEEVD